MVLDIAHHGGIPARVECDVADTGAAAISAGLIGKLVEAAVGDATGQTAVDVYAGVGLFAARLADRCAT